MTNCYESYKKCYKIMRLKLWTNQTCRRRYARKLSSNLIIFHNVANMIPVRLQTFIDTLTINEDIAPRPVGSGVVLTHQRLREIRERACMVAGMYRNARDQPQAMADLPRYCYWEIMWANASALDFLARMSGPKCCAMKPSTYIHNEPYYEISKCHLLVSRIELFSLWLIVCSLSGERQSLKFLLKMIRKESSRLRRENRRKRRTHEENGRAALCLLEGYCFASLYMPHSAIECFKKVARLKTKRRMDKYLLSYTMVESGICHYNIGMLEIGHHLLTVSRTKYSNGTNEFRALGRAYSKAMMIQVSDSE